MSAVKKHTFLVSCTRTIEAVVEVSAATPAEAMEAARQQIAGDAGAWDYSGDIFIETVEVDGEGLDESIEEGSAKANDAIGGAK